MCLWTVYEEGGQPLELRLGWFGILGCPLQLTERALGASFVTGCQRVGRREGLSLITHSWLLLWDLSAHGWFRGMLRWY